MASRFTDFPNGIASATEYLSSQNSLNAQLAGSVADIGRLVVSAQMDFNLKEIICSLLAGRGLKLPNIQICISLNLKELLGGIIGKVQQVLYDALAKLDAALDKFLSHLKLDQVLGRINSVLGEITNIANMINFCSAPLDPIQIPNVLENAMQSFLGKGKDLIDKIGSIIPGEIGGCLLDGAFNGDIWEDGIFKKIADNIDDLDSITDTLITDIDEVVTGIDDLVDSEDNTPTTYDNGGSDLSESPRTTYTGIGALFNAQDEGIGGAVRNGGALWAAYQQLASYQVVDNRGIVYNNIFETFVDDDLIRILRRPPNPISDIVEQQPVYNYCGEIIGYTRVATQELPQVSVGAIPDPIDQPGFNAGGLPTNPLNEALAQEAASGGGTVVQEINNVYNLDGSVLFVASEAAQIAANTQTGQLIYRTDIEVTYVDNGGTTGTIADFNIVGGGGSGTLSAFLSTVNSGAGTGHLVRNGADAFYRTIVGTANQLTVTNGNGVSGNPTLSLASNPILPGTSAVVLPKGTTGERATTVDGALRFNTTTNSFEGYQSGAWQSFATGAGSVVNGGNVGGGTYEVYKQNNSGVLEFRTLNSGGAVRLTVASDVITVDDVLTASSLGTGSAVFKQRTANNLEFRSITAGAGMTVTQNANDIEIATSGSGYSGTVSTTNATPTEVLFSGVRRTPGSNKTWFVEITAVANRTGTNDATAIRIEGLVDNATGAVTIVGTSGNKTIYNSTAATANYDLLLDVVSGTDFRVRVQGDTGHTVTWTVRYDFIEA
jgi:hypothetical protein